MLCLRRSSNQVLLPFFSPPKFDALGTNSVDDQAMIVDTEPMLSPHPTDQIRQSIALKLNQFATLSAVQMVMLWIAIVVLIDRSPIELKAIQQPGVNKLF